MNTTPIKLAVNASQFKLSKKSAQILGISFAESLHRFSSSEQRGAVISAYNDLIDILSYESRAIVQKAYYETLDKLEPLQTIKRAQA